MHDDELSPDEIIFLAQALKGPLLAFNPLEDPLVSSLIEREILAMKPDADPVHALLDLTSQGRAAVERQLR